MICRAVIRGGLLHQLILFNLAFIAKSKYVPFFREIAKTKSRVNGALPIRSNR